MPCWFAVVLDGDDDRRRTAMRTAPFGAHPAYLMPMPDEAAVHLAADAARPRRAGPRRPTARCRRSQVFCEDMARRDRRGSAGRPAHPALRARRPGRAAPAPGRAAPGHARRAGPGHLLVRRVHGRRRRAGRPRAGESPHESPTDEETRAADRAAAGSSSGSTTTTAGQRDRRDRPVVRRLPDRRRSTRPRSTAGRGYASAAVYAVSRAAARQRRAAVPVHRPGQPDVQQDLRGDRLPAGGRHGESARRSEALPRLGAT